MVPQGGVRQVKLLQDETTSTKGMTHMQTIYLFYILYEVIAQRTLNRYFFFAQT